MLRGELCPPFHPRGYFNHPAPMLREWIKLWGQHFSYFFREEIVLCPRGLILNQQQMLSLLNLFFDWQNILFLCFLRNQPSSSSQFQWQLTIILVILHCYFTAITLRSNLASEYFSLAKLLIRLHKSSCCGQICYFAVT